jgi:hypothetical protein
MTMTMQRRGFLKVAGATTPDAAVSIEVSNTPLPSTSFRERTDEIVWASPTEYSSDVTDNGTTCTYPIDISYRFVRVVYTYTSGTGGTVTVDFHAQGPE